jgi:hypothetical protein
VRPPQIDTDREIVIESRQSGDLEEPVEAESEDLNGVAEPEPAGRWIDGRWVPTDESVTSIAS